MDCFAKKRRVDRLKKVMNGDVEKKNPGELVKQEKEC